MVKEFEALQKLEPLFPHVPIKMWLGASGSIKSNNELKFPLKGIRRVLFQKAFINGLRLITVTHLV